MENYVIELKNITKSFGDNVILKNFDFKVKKNEFLTILGPSGCGKTTILRLIGGFEEPDEGEILFNGEDITNKEPYERKINTVFQKYALFPHMNVYKNIAFGLNIKKMEKNVIKEKVSEVLKLVNLEGFENRDEASAALTTIASYKGVEVLRVHTMKHHLLAKLVADSVRLNEVIEDVNFKPYSL